MKSLTEWLKILIFNYPLLKCFNKKTRVPKKTKNSNKNKKKPKNMLLTSLRHLQRLFSMRLVVNACFSSRR
jgi:hypothetical protein